MLAQESGGILIATNTALLWAALLVAWVGWVFVQVIKVATPMLTSPPESEDQIKSLEELISKAYKEIDKAVVKGVLHTNTAARKKARIARYKRHVLLAAGLFKPSEDHPDYARYQRMQVCTLCADAWERPFLQMNERPLLCCAGQEDCHSKLMSLLLQHLQPEGYRAA